MNLWNLRCGLYSRTRELSPFSRTINGEREALQSLVGHIDAPLRAHLDVGAGTGDTLRALPCCPLQVSVDASVGMLEKGVSPLPVVSLARALPFADASFDFVSAIGLTEYLGNCDMLFCEVTRILEPGGYFAFTSAPDTPANRARRFLGETLYLRDAAFIFGRLLLQPVSICATRNTWLQNQWLVRKSPGQ